MSILRRTLRIEDIPLQPPTRAMADALEHDQIRLAAHVAYEILFCTTGGGQILGNGTQRWRLHAEIVGVCADL